MTTESGGYDQLVAFGAQGRVLASLVVRIIAPLAVRVACWKPAELVAGRLAQPFRQVLAGVLRAALSISMGVFSSI